MLKIEGTNRRSPLESTKDAKNKPKTHRKQTQTNWFLSANKAKQSEKSGPKPVFCGALKLIALLSTGSLAGDEGMENDACATSNHRRRFFVAGNMP
jgi:hypothetical protein